MKPVVGISAFGLQDCVALPDARCHELGFYPTSAILPVNPFGRILTGDEAYRERTHVGLEWPPEARILPGAPVRRSPICAVWRALVEAGDRMTRWDAGHGVSFSLARILASHIKGLVAGTLPKEHRIEPASGQAKIPTSVVAIPNNLDEFGQELLLRELAALECPEAMLVWRPVAAALAWLNKVEGDFPRHMGENDHIHVVYLGPDGLEFSTFRLRIREHQNRYYVLPLRDRPRGPLPLTGMDWAGVLIEECFEGIDEGAFWQAFIQFPEIWQTLAGIEWNSGDLPRPWNRSHGWTLWNPAPDLYRHIYETRAASSVSLRRILGKSYDLSVCKELAGSIGEVLSQEVRDMAQRFPGGRLRGMVVCGPLASRMIPAWLTPNLDLLVSRGLNIHGNLAEPEAGRLWLSTNCDDPISEGAMIYGQRRLAEVPSYLDTMPQISILAQERGRFSWVPLLKAHEVLGGDEHKDKIERRFQLDAGKRNLHVYLYKGSMDDAPNETQDPFDPQSLPLDGVTPCKARLVREIVRRLGSLEAVQHHVISHIGAPETRYARRFAEALFAMRGGEQVNILEPPPTEIVQTPLRRAVFDFPSAPEQDTVLDIEVRIRPASGLAKIEILPEDITFLQGDRVLLNYSTMRFASKLPSRMRGWPRTDELVVDPDDDVLRSGRNLVEVFETTLPTARDYIRLIDQLRDRVIKGTTLRTVGGLQLYLGAVDQDGRACTGLGEEILYRIASKFESDFRRLQLERRTALMNKLFTRAAWLFALTPPVVVTYIRSILQAGFTFGGWKWAVEAASRAFVNVEDFRLLFQSIACLARSGPFDDKSFPIHAARSICRVLMLRKEGEQGLDREMAQLFANRALQRLLKEQEEHNFKTLYFQMIRLLLYLLRYRRIDPSCFDPNLPETIFVFEEAMKSMATAKDYFPSHSTKATQIKRIIEGFNKYLHYEGTEDLLPVLRDLAERDS